MSEWLEDIAAKLAAKTIVSPDAFLDVPGHLSVEDGRVLQEVFSGLPYVVDIGTHHGKSAVAIAAVAGKVVTIDHYQGDAQIGAPSYETARRAIREAGALAKVEQIDRCWKTALESGQVELPPGAGVFYDAAHTPKDLYELDFLKMVVSRPDVTIAVHDYKPLEEGMRAVVEAVNWFEEETGRKRHGPVYGSSVVWFEREV